MKRITQLAITASALALPAVAQGDLLLYVGTFTRGASKGIYACRFQPATGKLTALGLAVASSNPAFLAVHPDGRFLYSVNEDEKGMVSAFAIDAATSRLKLLNQVSSKGAGPCHLSLDHAGKWLFTANYDSGSAAAFPVRQDGSLGEASAWFQHAGNGVDKERQEASHAHMAAVSPDNRFVWIADLGLDELLSYRIDPEKGMTPNDPPFARVPAGSGPRHLVFSADSKFAYVVNELASTVTVVHYDAAKGTMEPVQTISSLPAAYKGTTWSAEIALHPNGKFLYASNRGHDSIAIFHVAPAAGTLTFAGTVKSGGQTPRAFALDPAGRYLLAADQESDKIVVFGIDPETGALSPTGNKLSIPSPVSLVFVSASR